LVLCSKKAARATAQLNKVLCSVMSQKTHSSRHKPDYSLTTEGQQPSTRSKKNDKKTFLGPLLQLDSQEIVGIRLIPRMEARQDAPHKEVGMRSRMIVVSMLVLALSMGARNANAARIVTANETTGQVPDFTFLTDSVLGQLCNANEDLTACFAPAYTVDASLISPAFQANGGFAGVDLNDPAGSDTPGNLSDQLYLRVTPIVVAPGFNVQWCWDSDREPNVNICQLPGENGWPGIPTGFTAVQLVEPSFGFVDVTSFFSGTAGPLAA
jgi:hypothetical protein